MFDVWRTMQVLLEHTHNGNVKCADWCTASWNKTRCAKVEKNVGDGRVEKQHISKPCWPFNQSSWTIWWVAIHIIQPGGGDEKQNDKNTIMIMHDMLFNVQTMLDSTTYKSCTIYLSARNAKCVGCREHLRSIWHNVRIKSQWIVTGERYGWENKLRTVEVSSNN